MLATSFDGLGAAPIVFTVEQPNYLLNNWRALQGTGDASYARLARSLGGVVNVTNGVCVIRYDAKVPDGFYIIDIAGRFTQVNPDKELEYAQCFPDVEAVKPNFAAMDKTPYISRAEIANFIEFINHARMSSNLVNDRVDLLMVDDIAVKDRSYYDQNKILPEFAFSFKLPFHERKRFDANALRIVLTEMLRYECVRLLYDNGLTRPSPLVLGVDWGHCAMIMPLR